MPVPKLVVIDRDGSLIRHIPYLCDAAQVDVLPTVREGLIKLRKAGCLLFLHTNQSGVGRGYYELEAVHACNEEMLRQLDLGAELFAGVCISPEAPDADIEYRKPSPRFARELLDQYQLGIADICYLGDNLSDLQTAQNLGCMGIGLNTGVHDLRQELAAQQLGDRFPVHDSFLAAVEFLLASEPLKV